MRWTEKPADLPLQPLSALALRACDVTAASLPDDGLLVIVQGDVREAVAMHLQSSDEEQGGVLLGEVFTDEADVTPVAARVVVLTRAVPSLDFSSSGISLRMETGVWERARLARAPAELVVGWYHSHPGLGAFFSATDRRTQAAFFPHPYSVGWVVDPVNAEEAFFVGRYSASPGRVLTLSAGESACDSGPVMEQASSARVCGSAPGSK